MAAAEPDNQTLLNLLRFKIEKAISEDTHSA